MKQKVETERAINRIFVVETLSYLIPKESLLSPIRSPGVSDNPKLYPILHTVPDHRDVMVDLSRIRFVNEHTLNIYDCLYKRTGVPRETS